MTLIQKSHSWTLNTRSQQLLRIELNIMTYVIKWTTCFCRSHGSKELNSSFHLPSFQPQPHCWDHVMLCQTSTPWFVGLDHLEKMHGTLIVNKSIIKYKMQWIYIITHIIIFSLISLLSRLNSWKFGLIKTNSIKSNLFGSSRSE